MGATERWYYIEVVRHTENDGPRADGMASGGRLPGFSCQVCL